MTVSGAESVTRLAEEWLATARDADSGRAAQQVTRAARRRLAAIPPRSHSLEDATVLAKLP
jgi:hypothetical protein